MTIVGPLRRLHLAALLFLTVLMIFSGFALADVCNPYCCPIGPGGGGGPAPTPTPDPYAWISNLPLYGETPHILGVWTYHGAAVGLWWYGYVYDQATVVNPSDVELSLSSVGPNMIMQTNNGLWEWGGSIMHDDLNTQHTWSGWGIAIVPGCQTLLPGPPAGYISIIAGCNNFAPIDLVGMNAILHEAPESGDSGVIPYQNYTIDFPHRLS